MNGYKGSRMIKKKISIKQELIFNEMIKQFSCFQFRALGGSMSPTINSKDIITVEKCKAEKVKSGDIIACQIGESLIVHRLMYFGKVGDEIVMITKGDSIPTIDNPISSSKLIGKIVKAGDEKQPGRNIFNNILGEIYKMSRIIKPIIKFIARGEMEKIIRILHQYF